MSAPQRQMGPPVAAFAIAYPSQYSGSACKQRQTLWLRCYRNPGHRPLKHWLAHPYGGERYGTFHRRGSDESQESRSPNT